MGKLFGGGKSKSESSSVSESKNVTLPTIQTQFNPVAESANTGMDSINRLLGLGGDATQQAEAMNRFKDSAGYGFVRDQGMEAIKGGNASQGLFNSGATGEALSRFGTGLAGATLQDYLKSLFGVTQTGLGAGNLIAGTGNVSNASSKGMNESTQNADIGGAVGSIGASIAKSDPRCKKDIEKIGELPNGLGVYNFNYIDQSDGEGLQIGVMADEVKKIQPDALGPIVDGYMTVDYSKIEGIENVA